MAMTYADLKIHVQDITEMTFTDAQLGMFTKQAEQKIYGFIKDLPILKKDTTIAFNRAATLPADCLYIHSVTQKTGDGGVNRKALIPKDYDFLFESYPLSEQAPTVDEPELKYYALNSSSDSRYSASRMTITVAPRWNTTVQCLIEYQYQPRSIVDTDGDEEEPWLGENYDSALLNAVLVEAARFMKAEPDIIQLYEQQFVMALQPMIDTVNVRLQSDAYRPKSIPAQPLTVPAPPQPRQPQE